MRIESEEKALKNLKNRISILSRGIVLPDESIRVIHLQSAQGGAGPRGITCYIGDAPDDHKNQVSLIVYPKDHYMARYALSTRWWTEDNQDTEKEKKKIVYTDDHIFLEEVPFNWKKGWFKGKKTIYLVKPRFHPFRTYSMSFYRGCRHMDQNEGCKFCTNSLLTDKFNLPKKFPNRLNLRYLKLGMTNNPVRSITLTSGTMGTPEKTMKEISLSRRNL